jgi:multidrug efflux pump subunit AcrB
MGFSMILAVICIYMILASQFESLLHPFTIMVSLPFSLIGAFGGMLIAGMHMSIFAMIGLIMLMGIATKNSILLIDYALLARRGLSGGPPLSRWDALLDACHKRARPIVMTTVAMGAGMLPIAIGFGTDPSFRAPMAIVVIGGLITSTFLSLLVIPVVFTFVDDGVEALKGLWRKRSTH